MTRSILRHLQEPRRDRPAAAAQGGSAAADRPRPVQRRFHPAGAGLCRDRALAPPARPDRRGSACGGRRRCRGCSASSTGAGLPGRRAGADPAQPGAVDPIRHETDRPRRRPDLHRPANAAAGRQGAPCRRGGGDGRRRDRGAGAGRRRGGRGRIRGIALVAQMQDALAPGAPAVWDEVPDNVLVDTSFGDAGGDRARLCRRRPRRRDGVPHRPRHRRADRAARRPRPLGQRDRPLHLCGPAAAARCGKRPSSPRCSASRPSRCGCCRSMSAAISARATASMSNSGWCCGRRAGSAARSNTPRPGRRCSSAIIRAATCRPESRWRCAPTAGFSACAPTMSAMSAPAASRCRRSSKGSALVTGSYDIPAARLRSRAVFTNTMPTNAYRSSGRPEVTYAIERLVDEAARRLGIDRVAIAPDEPRRRRRRCPTPTPSAPATTAAPTRPTWIWRCGSPTGTVSRRAGPRREARGRLLGLGLANYVEILDRRAARAQRDHGDARRPGRGRDRHRAERAGPRDQLRPGGRRAARGAGREHRHHHGRHRRRQPRRRLAFRPLDAPCRDLVRHGRARIDRQRQGGRRPAARDERRRGRPSPTAGFRRRRTTAASIFSNWRGKARGSAPMASSRWSPTTRCTTRSFRTAAPCARSRSIPRPARSRSPAIRWSTMSGAASIR